MYQVTDAHFLTVIAVSAATLLVPLYVFAMYVYSGAQAARGLQIATGFLIFGALITWVVLAEAASVLGPFAALSVTVAWVLPSLLLWWRPDWFLEHELSQKWLIGYQGIRLIGGLFLIEMMLGNLPGLFAIPAGFGDMLVGLVAVAVWLRYRNAAELPAFAIILVVVLGLTDFATALFFAFTTTEGPGQIFYPEVTNTALLFPVGMLPYFLVPVAIFMHVLSLLNYRKFQR